MPTRVTVKLNSNVRSVINMGSLSVTRETRGFNDSGLTSTVRVDSIPFASNAEPIAYYATRWEVTHEVQFTSPGVDRSGCGEPATGRACAAAENRVYVHHVGHISPRAGGQRDLGE